MKKSLLLSSLMVAGVVATSQADRVTPEEAFARINRSTPAKAMSTKVRNSFKYDSTIENLYLFKSQHGYMILPNNDEAPAVLGYSDNSDFSTEGNPALQEWLNFYNKELSYLNNNSVSSKASAQAARPERAPIEPLTKTLWNQSAPYNDDCPLDNGERSVTGCVATAMAQVMKYHNWPDKGVGSNSYTSSTLGQTLSFDFANTTFDWTNMTNTYDSSSTAEQKTAVANLMYACGVSVDMDYTSDESSASSIKMGQALINNFNYNKGLWMPMRDFYGLYDWEDMIYDNLEKGLPVLYAGQGTAGGHQFICDGYSSDGYFHFNWGWGGLSDGYFLLTALNPESLGIGGGAGGFNTNQQIALNVKPSTGDETPTYIMYWEGDFTSGESSVSEGSYFSLGSQEGEALCYNMSMESIPAGLRMGVRIVSADGSYNQYVAGPAVSQAVPTLAGLREYYVPFPSLTDGTYTITPAFNPGDGWKDIPTQIGKTGSIIATVTDGTASLSSSQAATVEVTNIVAPETIYIGTEFPLTFSVVNNSSEEYVGDIIPILLDANYSEVAQSVYSPVDVLPNTTDDVTSYIGKFTAVNGATLSAGTYALIFIDSNGNEISEPVEVTLAETPSTTTYTVSNLKLVSPNPVTDSSDVKFTLDVSCTEGYFAKALNVVIFPYRSGQVSSVASNSTETLFLNGGESKTVTVSLNLSRLGSGSYFAAVFDGTKQVTNQDEVVVFELKDLTTGITAIKTDATSETIYNLQGQKCQRPLQPGIYIINGKKVIL